MGKRSIHEHGGTEYDVWDDGENQCLVKPVRPVPDALYDRVGIRGECTPQGTEYRVVAESERNSATARTSRREHLAALQAACRFLRLVR